MEAGKDDGTLARIDMALESLGWVGQVPWVYWLDDFLAPYIGHKLGTVLRHGKIRAYAAEQVEARRSRATEHRDILGRLFEVQAENPEKLETNAIVSLATANVFAGSDTTAITLRAIIYFLLTNPDCLEKLLHETAEQEKDGRLTWPIKFNQANEMPYLQACIQESLRLHPAVGLSLPRVVPEGGYKIGSRFFPAGVSQNMLLL